MAEGRIKQLIDRYEELRTEKDELKKKTTENNEAFTQIQLELAKAISDADMTDATDGDYTYTPGVTTKYSFKSLGDLEELGLDKFEPFENDDALKFLVKKDINWRSLNSALSEMAEMPGGIPDEVMAVLSTFDEVGITRRKKDTKAKNKVAAALKKMEG
jgi:hypothetical protein